MDKLPRLTTELCDLATQAGGKIMNFYEEGADVTWKEDAFGKTFKIGEKFV
jgi:hypothetical protein